MEDEELEVRLEKLLKIMEIYNFASCMDEFQQKEIPPGSGQIYPSIVEHFVNQHDLVPAFTPQQSYGFTGAVFERVGAWGHLLNAHYLDTGDLDMYKPQDGRQVSQLAHYLAEVKDIIPDGENPA
jgi:hypothetical protein